MKLPGLRRLVFSGDLGRWDRPTLRDPELIPQRIHGHTLFDGTATALAHRIQDVWHLEAPTGYEDEQASILSQFDPMYACKAIDERLEHLVASQQQAVAR